MIFASAYNESMYCLKKLVFFIYVQNLTYFLKKSLFLRSNAGIMTDFSSKMFLYRTIHHVETLSGSITVLSHVWRYFKVIDDHLQNTLSQKYCILKNFSPISLKILISSLKIILKNRLLTSLSCGFFLRSRNIWSVRSKQF